MVRVLILLVLWQSTIGDAEPSRMETSAARRQSETALVIARGTGRLLRSLGFACLSELPLPSGRRADLVAVNARGEIWIVEIKSSAEDLRADRKWQITGSIVIGCSSLSRAICRAI
jgi:hypothetical protein